MKFIELEFLIFFVVFVVGILLIDLLLVGKKSHKVEFKEALIWSIIWIGVGLSFSLFLKFFGELLHGISNIENLSLVCKKYMPYLKIDHENYIASVQLYRNNLTINYLSVYFIEKTLSVDNIFVMILILSSFSIPDKYHKKVLFWGILGAIIFRCLFIFVGSALIQKFEWILYIFGGILLYSAVKMFMKKEETDTQFSENRLNKFLIKILPLYPRIVRERFFLKKGRKIFITPLFLALISIEFADIIFAFDSVPAAFSVSRDPFIIFFANIFAIIGLRALFFLLASAVRKFHFLKPGVAILLIFVGIKLILHEWLENIHFKNTYSLYFILLVILSSILLSLLIPKNQLPE